MCSRQKKTRKIWQKTAEKVRTSCFCWTTKEKFKADHKFKIKAENKIQVAYDPHATSDKWFKELHHAYGVSFFEKLFKYLG